MDKIPLINRLKIWRKKCPSCGWRMSDLTFHMCGLCFFCCNKEHYPNDLKHRK